MLIKCRLLQCRRKSKVASERAKDPEKKKDLASAHRVYQQYINANKKSKD